METINALNIDNQSDYKDLGDILFLLLSKETPETFLIKRDDVIGFNVSKSLFTLKLNYIYNINDLLNKFPVIDKMQICIQKFNLHYKRFSILADVSYSGNTMSNDYIELFFTVKGIKYEEL